MSKRIEYKEINVKRAGDIPHVGAYVVIWPNGTKFWVVNCELHNIEGPAIKWCDGSVDYWIEGKWHSEDAYRREVKRIKDEAKLFGIRDALMADGIDGDVLFDRIRSDLGRGLIAEARYHLNFIDKIVYEVAR